MGRVVMCERDAREPASDSWVLAVAPGQASGIWVGRRVGLLPSSPDPDQANEELFSQYEADINLLRDHQRSLSAIAESLEIVFDEWHSLWTMWPAAAGE